MRWVDRFDSDNSEDPIDIIEAPNAKYTAKEPSLNIPKYK